MYNQEGIAECLVAGLENFSRKIGKEENWKT